MTYFGPYGPTSIPPMQTCATCGAQWITHHTCPNAPRSTSAPTFPPSPVAILPTAAEVEVIRLRILLTSILSYFTEKGHPGMACLRTPWLRVQTIEEWRAQIEAPANARGSES